MNVPKRGREILNIGQCERIYMEYVCFCVTQIGVGISIVEEDHMRVSTVSSTTKIPTQSKYRST